MNSNPDAKPMTVDDAPLKMTLFQSVRHRIWRMRANRAFDNRDQREPGTPEWEAADKRLRKVFGE
jgi:hypothetical protein